MRGSSGWWDRRAARTGASIAVACAAMLTAPVAWGAEPADDHAGGAVLQTRFGIPVTAAIDRPGDRDWYAVKLTGDDDFHVTIRRSAGGCAAEALRVTVLSPEVHAIRWKTVLPDTATSSELPKNQRGLYFVEIDAQGEPGCGGMSYTLTLVRESGVGGSGSGSGAECQAAKGTLHDDKVARSAFKKYLKSRDPKTVARYKKKDRKAAARLKADNADLRRYCPKKKR